MEVYLTTVALSYKKSKYAVHLFRVKFNCYAKYIKETENKMCVGGLIVNVIYILNRN